MQALLCPPESLRFIAFADKRRWSEKSSIGNSSTKLLAALTLCRLVDSESVVMVVSRICKQQLFSDLATPALNEVSRA